MKKTKVGLIGCGNISRTYLNAAKIFQIMEISSCADINPTAARERGAEFEAVLARVFSIDHVDDSQVMIKCFVENRK